MSQKQVWCPGNSYAAAQEGWEEGGWGSTVQAASSSSEPEQDHALPKTKKISIPRRTTPTVRIPPRSRAAHGSSTAEQEKQNYKTIEQRKTWTLHELSFMAYDKYRSADPKNQSRFCGWTDEEQQDEQTRTYNRSQASEAVDRTGLQTPADGHRSNLCSRASNSRYNSSHGGRRVNHYTFHHYQQAEDYVQEYRDLYCYTSLNTAPSSANQRGDRIFFEGEDVEQDSDGIQVKSLYQGDPYLRELVSRLGIKEPADLEGRHQFQAPRPTPPSIVKRRRNEPETVDIVVSNSATKRYLNNTINPNNY